MKRLEKLSIKKLVNKTRLKDHLLERFPESQEQYDGRNTVFVLKEGMRNMLNDALKTRDFSKDALMLAKAAMLVRKDILSHRGFKFTGCSRLNTKKT